jgi:hypothetical protein
MATGTGPASLRERPDRRRSEGRARADHHCARPFPITVDELARAAEAPARMVRVALLELEVGARRIFGRPRRIAKDRQRNLSRT